MKNVLKSLAQSVLIPAGLITTVWVVDAAIERNIFGSGMTTNEEIGDFMKIVKYFEKLGFMIKAVTKKIKNE